MRAVVHNPRARGWDLPGAGMSRPLVCQLCDGTSFACEADFAKHKDEMHSGENEYRKRVGPDANLYDAMSTQPVPPRMVAEVANISSNRQIDLIALIKTVSQTRKTQ